MADENTKGGRLGKYEILRLLDEEADGQLYSAVDTESGRRVVLKVMAYDTGPAVGAVGGTAGRRPSSGLASAARVAVVLLVVAAVGGSGYWFGGGRLGPPKRATVQTPAARPVQTPAPPGAAGTAVAPAPFPQKSREEIAQEAFNKATADWQSRRAGGDYGAGIAAFSAVAQEHADTPAAARSRAEIARVYTDWARADAAAGNLDAAVADYAKAIEAAPAPDPAGDPAREAMPAALGALAEFHAAAGDYEKALGATDELVQRYPGAAEAAQAQKQRPGLLLAQGLALWRNEKDLDKALPALQEVARAYGATRPGRQAKEALPDAYAEAVRQKLDAGQPDEASRYLNELVKAYPERRDTTRIAELDAEVLFRLFERAQSAGLGDEATQYSDELARRHPASPWVVKSGRMKLDLEGPAAGPLVGTTPRNQLKVAQAQYDRMEFKSAIEGLKSVIRAASEDSPEAAEALAKLPGWLYESALHDYGAGAEEECEAALGDLSAQFPGTAWDRKAAETLDRAKNPPAGMTYVPEGRFRMGTDSAEIVALLRKLGAAAEGDEESVKLFAELSGFMAETPKHVASTGAFFIDKMEVTNEQYKQYLDAAEAAPPPQWRNGAYPAGDGSLPVTGVSQTEAAAYAKWRGGRLPTETEWEKAARGIDGRRYPWGDEFDQKRSQHMRPDAAGTVPVGSFPSGAGPYGCLDMIGNAREWTASAMSPYDGTEWQNASGSAGLGAARGGAWFQEELAAIPARCASRYPVDPTRPNKATGFRCVRDVPGAEQPAGPPTRPLP